MENAVYKIVIALNNGEQVKFIEHNIGILQLETFSLITKEYIRGFIKEFDLFIVKNGIQFEPLEISIEKLKTSSVRHIDVFTDDSSSIRYYTINDSTFATLNVDEEDEDFIVSIHKKKEPLSFEDIDKDTIYQDVYDGFVKKELLQI